MTLDEYKSQQVDNRSLYRNDVQRNVIAQPAPSTEYVKQTSNYLPVIAILTLVLTVIFTLIAQYMVKQRRKNG